MNFPDTACADWDGREERGDFWSSSSAPYLLEQWITEVDNDLFNSQSRILYLGGYTFVSV